MKKIYGVITETLTETFFNEPSKPTLIIFENEEKAEKWEKEKISTFLKREIVDINQAIKIFGEKEVEEMEEWTKGEGKEILKKINKKIKKYR